MQKEKAIAAINAYYAALINQSATDKAEASTKILTDSTDDYVQKLEALKPRHPKRQWKQNAPEH